MNYIADQYIHILSEKLIYNTSYDINYNLIKNNTYEVAIDLYLGRYGIKRNIPIAAILLKMLLDIDPRAYGWYGEWLYGYKNLPEEAKQIWTLGKEKGDDYSRARLDYDYTLEEQSHYNTIFLKLCHENHILACYHYGCTFDVSKNSFRWVEHAARSGLQIAQAQLCEWFSTGTSIIPKNKELYEYWLNQTRL